MPDPEVRDVTVTAQDIQSVNEKLQAFAEQLPPGEQNVVAWLLGRAAQAGEQRAEFLEEAAATEEARIAEPAVSEPLANALGIPQFSKLEPGSMVAGSSIGVTGTVMF